INISALGLAVFYQYRGDALRDFPFLLRRPAFHPGNLHVRHVPSPLRTRNSLFLACNLWHSIRPNGSRKVHGVHVLELSAHASRHSSPDRTAARGPPDCCPARGTGSVSKTHP